MEGLHAEEGLLGWLCFMHGPVGGLLEGPLHEPMCLGLACPQKHLSFSSQSPQAHPECHVASQATAHAGITDDKAPACMHCVKASCRHKMKACSGLNVGGH